MDFDTKTLMAEALDTAKELVTGNRNIQNGDFIENHEKVALLWCAYLKASLGINAPLKAVHIADMMDLFKMVRCHSGEFNKDDYVDRLGYAAGAYACAKSL